MLSPSKPLHMQRLEFDLFVLGSWALGYRHRDLGSFGVFWNSRDRLLEGDISAKFVYALLKQPGSCITLAASCDTSRSSMVGALELARTAASLGDFPTTTRSARRSTGLKRSW